MSDPARKSLIVLVADADALIAVRGIMERHRALGIRQLPGTAFEVVRHPGRDPGCRRDGPEFLRPSVGKYERAVILFDHAGCGDESRPAQAIESGLEELMRGTGWHDAGVVVIEPELEAWVWSDSPHVAEELGWKGRNHELRSWLISEHLTQSQRQKPNDPKEAMMRACRAAGKSASRSILSDLARTVSLDRCQDRAFLKFKGLLQKWFGLES